MPHQEMIRAVAILMAATVAAGSRAMAASEFTLDGICAAWEARSRQVTNGHIQWEGQFTTAESLDGRTDHTSACSKEIKWAGSDLSRIYYSKNGLMRNGRTGKLENVHYKAGYDGNQRRLLTSFPEASYVEGTVLPDFHLHVRDVELKPIILHFHTLNPKMGGYQREALKLTDRQGIVDDDDCLIIEVGGPVREIWVAPTHDFLIRRYRTRRQDGSSRDQVDIRYQRESGIGWVPISWEIVSLRPDGTHDYSYAESVTGYQFNTAMDDADFRIEFPPGALVRHDHPDARQQQFAIVLTDGTTRGLTATEARAVYVKGTSRLGELGGPLSGEPVANRPRWLVWFAVMFIALPLVPVVVNAVRRGLHAK
jgi:hypothetical protein